MKKIAISSMFALALTVQSSSSAEPQSMDKEPALRDFVTHMNTLTSHGQIQEIHDTTCSEAYKARRAYALAPETLNRVPLDSKYNLVGEIFTVYNVSVAKPCEPIHVAQAILDSFDSTSGAQPEVLHSMMKLFLNAALPKTSNLILVKWSTYVVEQCRNPELSISLRKKFAKLYPLIGGSNSTAFRDKLLKEIEESQ